MTILTNPQERKRFLRFAVVGALGAVVDFGVFNLLTQLTKIIPVWATGISFVAAVCSNFIWNRYWTYPDSRSKSFVAQVGQFFLINAIGLAIRIPLFAWLEKVLVSFVSRLIKPSFFLTPTFIGHNISLAAVILVVMLWNFFANRFWTYNDVK
jgi:putative flippase GtrA